VEPASAFNATINWGDGTTSAGTIIQSGTTYAVTGSHTYAKSGSHTITVSVTEAGTGGVLVALGGFAGLLELPATDPTSLATPASVGESSGNGNGRRENAHSAEMRGLVSPALLSPWARPEGVSDPGDGTGSREAASVAAPPAGAVPEEGLWAKWW
jgi:hypothetical protein